MRAAQERASQESVDFVIKMLSTSTISKLLANKLSHFIIRPFNGVSSPSSTSAQLFSALVDRSNLQTKAGLWLNKPWPDQISSSFIARPLLSS